MRGFAGISTRHSRAGPEIRAVRRVLLTFLGLFLASGIAAGWYVYDKGFTRTWRNQVSAEFRKRGVEVSLRRLTVDPFRGLVARDMQVFDARDHRRTLAVIDEMQLGVNYAALLRRENFIERSTSARRRSRSRLIRKAESCARRDLAAQCAPVPPAAANLSRARRGRDSWASRVRVGPADQPADLLAAKAPGTCAGRRCGAHCRGDQGAQIQAAPP